ncbi:unnamed protein product [Mytilus edulis]|uniref:WSC domain-containing protein n=1 Tax=Mytilus edulis TaxID=6550 RepID=A0A8S3VLG8_MYTED|nr:unnamed protein product [Mytilus edulis]
MVQVIRTLPYGKLDMSTMTNDICASHCCSFLGDATFSGTSAWYQCFCSNVTNTDNFVPRSLSDCYMACGGNPGEMCGGSWRLSVYGIDCSSTTFVATPKQRLVTTSEIFTMITTRPSIMSDKSTMMSTNLTTRSHISTLITELTTEITKPACLESTTDKPQLDLQAGVASNYSLCSCADCLPSNNTTWTLEEIANKVTLLKNAI